MDQKLIIFLKYPEEGKVKTRLASSIGAHEAACVYKKLAEDTVSQARPLAGRFADIVIAYDPPERENEIKRWISGPFKYEAQEGKNLGQRLDRVVNAAFLDGAKRVVVVGSDCPGLDSLTVNRAFWALLKKDVVIGPSRDGGYYLIGFNQARHTVLLDDIPWSTPEVLRHTLDKAKKSDISTELLSEKSDVDTADDLKRFSRAKHDHSCDALRISVIIPTLNEGKNIESTLVHLTRQHHPHEIVVADGGSDDKTMEVASRYAKVVRCPKGRARQMNEGAQTATGDVFLFLHADTQLPNNALPKIEDALQSGKKRSGRFRMSFGHGHPLLKFYEYHTRFHCFSYGDQAFFVKRELFQKMGGFSVDAIFEDIDFYGRLLKNEKPVIIREPVITSPRRFLQNGILRQKFINISLATMYYLGFRRSTIKYFRNAWYKDIREHAEYKKV